MPGSAEMDARPPRGAAEFEIRASEPDARTSVVTVAGELDLSTAPRLKRMLLDALQTGHSRLVVDLSGATFMDSTALGVLVGVRRALEVGEQLTIVCPRGDVLQIFELTGMRDAFAIVATQDEALGGARGDRAHAG
ncbi:MAG TPA: STAS domain-containing protein [Solirubrobacteraceae bacterium]|jgi:anti-sigma B factor antagonist|nr:STAS domain-containing protein [Solirubrobacteraceae bacterium]